jgi:hypothetical protein
LADAKKKHKHKHKKKKQKANFNDFGCVDVGNFCKNDDQCCSGVCEGDKCQAHDANGCQTGQNELICGGTNQVCISTDGKGGFCNTTTGNAGYCAAKDGVLCLACTKDADCVQFCGSRAACIVCQNAECGGTTICASAVTGGCL